MCIKKIDIVYEASKIFGSQCLIGSVDYIEKENERFVVESSNKITNYIKKLYYLHPTNYAAALMQGKDIKYSIERSKDIEESIDYLKRRISLIQDEMHPYLLNQYSNVIS